MRAGMQRQAKADRFSPVICHLNQIKPDNWRNFTPF
jgi:hypothetical protein